MEFKTDCQYLLLYRDDLVIKAESMKELLVKLDACNGSIGRRKVYM